MISSVGIKISLLLGLFYKHQLPQSPISNIIYDLPERWKDRISHYGSTMYVDTLHGEVLSSQHEEPAFTSHCTPDAVLGYADHSVLTITLFVGLLCFSWLPVPTTFLHQRQLVISNRSSSSYYQLLNSYSVPGALHMLIHLIAGQWPCELWGRYYYLSSFHR